MNKKKILVTGSSGYIGQHLIKMLANFSNYEVYSLDYNPLNESTLSQNIRYDFQRWIFSLNDMPDEFDVVIHLAALVRVNESVENPWKYYDTNVNGTQRVLSNIPTKSFIFASTGAATIPNSPYAYSKRMAEEIVANYCTKYKIPYTTFRFYNVIGTDGIPPTNVDGLFHNLLTARDNGIFYLHGDDWNTPDGTCVRDYLHVNEVCFSIIDSIERPANQIENLGHGVGYSVKQMIDIFKQVNNCDFEVKVLPRRPGDVESTVLDDVSRYMKPVYSIEQLLKV